MGASLRAGVRAAPEDADAYLVALADMPGITPELIASLIACYARGRQADRGARSAVDAAGTR